MKTKTTLLLFLLLTINSFSQAPNWMWAKSAGGSNIDYGLSCSADLNGNVIVAGVFYSNAITFGTTTFINAGLYDLYIVKYDGNGNVLWAKSAGGSDNDVANGCSVDAFGNILVTGSFAGNTITFGTTTLINPTPGNQNMFLVKYDSNGNLLWARNAAGNSNSYGNGCTVNTNGDIIATGSFSSSTIVFGSTTLYSTDLSDVFVVKYDSNGNPLWAKSAGGNLDDMGYSCATDHSGNIIVSGSFVSDTIRFGTTYLTHMNTLDDMFLVKYNSNGNVIWAKNTGGDSPNDDRNIATDNDGSIIITGYFLSDSISFGTTVLYNSSSNVQDILIVKYDSSGNVKWAKSEGGINDDIGYSCTIDHDGNSIVTGLFRSSFINPGTTTLNNVFTGSADMFIIKYDANGNALWAKSAGGTTEDFGASCATDPFGNIFVTGSFDSPTVIFGTDTLANPGGHDLDIFVVKMKNDLAGVSEIDKQNELLVYPNPNNGIFRVRSNKYKVTGLEVYNIIGEKVYSSEIKQPDFEIDLSNQANGIYFIHMKTDQGLESKKIIINK